MRGEVRHMSEVVFDLNKENLLRMVRTITGGNAKAIVSPFALVHVFQRGDEEIGAVMKELVKEGKLIKMDFNGMDGYKLK